MKSGGGIILLIGAAAAAIYFLTRSSSTSSGSITQQANAQYLANAAYLGQPQQMWYQMSGLGGWA